MKKTLLLLSLIISTISATALQPQRGYRAMIDANMSLIPNIGFIAGEPGDSEVMLGGTTSHGYQFNNWLYVGGGAGFEYNPSWKSYHSSETRFIIPIFAEARADACWGRFTPFLSVRLGANVANHGGIYFSPIVGYRFNWGRRCAINFGLGLNLFGRRYTFPNYVLQPGGGLAPDGTTYSYTGSEAKFAIRLGFEFQL